MICVTVKAETFGGHTHCRVYTAPGPGRQRGFAGKLTLRNEEWEALREHLLRAAPAEHPEVLRIEETALA